MGEEKGEGCPKCKTGKMTLDKDFYGWFEYCVQCGFVRDLPDLPKFHQNGIKMRHQQPA